MNAVTPEKSRIPSPKEVSGHRDEASVARQFFLNTAATIERRGVDIAALCQRRGIANPAGHAGDRIPLTIISPFYDVLVEETGDPEFILKVAATAEQQPNDLLVQLILCSPTLLEATRQLCRYSAIASDAVTYHFLEYSDHIDLVVIPCAETYVSRHQIDQPAAAVPTSTTG